MMNRPQVPAVSPQETYAHLTDGDAAQAPVVVDVREADEWAEGHIEGAKHIPLGQLSAQANEIPHDREVIFVCHSGQRSAVATASFMRAGYTNVANMQGGMEAWENQHLPIQRG
jgi:rhodanese-related sulfurtransferase